MGPDHETLGAVLREGAARLAGVNTAQLDARVLLKFVTGYDDAALIAHSCDSLDSNKRALFFDYIARRARHEPIAYITGVREFWSLDFHVTPDVLIPRADSECLIEAVLSRRSKNRPWSILDLGAGSGCLLCALLSELPSAHGVGVDISPAALSVARDNADRLGVGDRASFVISDWAASLTGVYDIIVANPPYIPEEDREALPADVSGHEPSSALFSGREGFADYEAILWDIPQLLAPGGLFAIEAGDGQAVKLSAMVAAAFPNIAPVIVNDLKGLPRSIISDQNSLSKKD